MNRPDTAVVERLLGAELMGVRTDVPKAGPYGGSVEEVPQQAKPTYRGTTNRNERGNSEERRRRREWLVRSYRADMDVIVVELAYGQVVVPVVTDTEHSEPACRCYRCGELLTVATVSADRIKPGCEGGTYARSNIRPACGRCNSITGAVLGNARKAGRRR